MNRNSIKKAVLILAAAAAVAAAVFGIVIWRAGSEASAAVDAYNAAAEEYNARIAPYNEAAARIADANEGLQAVLDTANGLLDKGAEAYEPKTREKLRRKVKEAQEALVEVPVQIEPFEMRSVTRSFHKAELEAQKTRAQTAAAGVAEAGEKIPPVPEVPDYSSHIQEVEEAQKAYSDSVQKLANVTAPPDTFVIERLQGIGTAEAVGAVSEKNDPNQLLGKKGGYIGCVYFLDSRVDRDLLPADAFPEETDEPKESDEPEGLEESEGSEESADGSDPGETGSAASAATDSPASASTDSPASASTDSPASAATDSAASAAADSTASTAGPAGSSGTSEPAADGAMEAAGAASSADPADPAGESSESAESGPRIDVVRIGTEGGGAVEIFATAEEAQKRAEYLAFFEGSVMDPGSHAVEGTCVIRTSKHLGEEEQEELTEKIREALLQVK